MVNKKQILCIVSISLFVAVSCTSCGPTNNREDDETASSRDCSELEPENPYSPGSGHYAGFEWAEQNDPASCGGNSYSFIEGCEEYQEQSAAYEECLSGE